MKFLATLQHTKPNTLLVMDMAIIVSILPLFVIVKAPMILFLLIAITLIAIKKKPMPQSHTLFILFLGMIAMYLSLYGSFNVQGLSRLKLFLELIIYILLTVVAMQRLTRNINFYLLLSPMLFLSLSLFFFHSLLMLIYVLFEIFFLLWMILTHRMNSSMIESFRTTMVMLLYSLPWVIILFIFFPRISFEHASYGFKGEEKRRMGHDGTMFLDNNALLVPSGRIVMEINFEKEVPKNSTLYFRGSMLYIDKKDHWEPLPKPIQNRLEQKSNIYYPQQAKKTNYIVTLYPTQKKWLYLLDFPAFAVKDTHLNQDFITTTKKPIIDPIHYKASSSLQNHIQVPIDRVTKKIALHYDTKSNPKSYQKAQEIKNLPLSPQEKIHKIVTFFQEQNLTYTLKPDLLDINNTTDSFLFDKKLGYCVHFTSSFVTMARMVGIPARIVTGFKADKSNGYNNYLLVKESDAHAWAEVYINQQWQRVETTSTASYVKQNVTQAKEKKDKLSQLNLYLRYIKYQVETWILHYSNLRQLQLLKYAKAHPSFIFGFIVTILILIIGTLLAVSYFKKQRQENKVLAILTPLINHLKKEQYQREEEETLHQFFQRYAQDTKISLEKRVLALKIYQEYEAILYGENDSKKRRDILKREVKAFLKLSKSNILSLFN